MWGRSPASCSGCHESFPAAQTAVLQEGAQPRPRAPRALADGALAFKPGSSTTFHQLARRHEQARLLVRRQDDAPPHARVPAAAARPRLGRKQIRKAGGASRCMHGASHTSRCPGLVRRAQAESRDSRSPQPLRTGERWHLFMRCGSAPGRRRRRRPRTRGSSAAHLLREEGGIRGEGNCACCCLLLLFARARVRFAIWWLCAWDRPRTARRRVQSKSKSWPKLAVWGGGLCSWLVREARIGAHSHS